VEVDMDRFTVDSFWICPEGEIIPVTETHILTVFSRPSKFGLSQEEVDEIKGSENRSIAERRLEVSLIKSGWIVISEYENNFSWIINVFKMTSDCRESIKNWAEIMLAQGRNVYRPVLINSVLDGKEGSFLKKLQAI
jgi:hypothetical protein